MSLKVKLFLFGQKDKDFQWISVGEGSKKLRSFLKELNNQKSVKFIQDGCVVIINDQLITDDRALEEGDEIKIFPMLHGG
jgi:molybdopterin converting factor small subunit